MKHVIVGGVAGGATAAARIRRALAGGAACHGDARRGNLQRVAAAGSTHETGL